MSTPTIIATENLVEEMESWGLHHATYWSSNLNSWGSVSDWDVYFIDKTPGCTKDEAHRSLSLELNILLKKLSDRSRQYSKANALKKALENSDNDSANILLWNKHLKELESIAISDLVHRVSHYQKYYYTRRNWTSQRADIREIKKNKASTKECEISSSSSSSKNDENYNKQEDDDAIISGMLQVNVCYKFITLPMHIFSDLGNDLREASESMVGKANDEPPKTPEHQIYQKQGDYSKPFASCEEQSHGFHSSEISQNLGDSIESNDHDSDEDEFGLKDMNLFKQRFEALDSSRKWKLRSERLVEDVLYKLGMQCRYHNLVHSFIIDTEDTFIKDEFSEEELSEIVEKNKEQSIPEIDEKILEYIDTFAKYFINLKFAIYNVLLLKTISPTKVTFSQIEFVKIPCQDFVFWNIYRRDNIMSEKDVIRKNVHSGFCPVENRCQEKVTAFDTLNSVDGWSLSAYYFDGHVLSRRFFIWKCGLRCCFILNLNNSFRFHWILEFLFFLMQNSGISMALRMWDFDGMDT
ncbi:hypothetical protein RhiirA5_410064 [Rhizophagus irregularis]|uniref:Uncharacterized protein n=1 Tax=Rhizophagus irregularis TaxID=588596 RepID=A0A2N0Q457_9GLOM|nr:hypothetical protein RhiirA5_410064 [Rhizophagus irregularis]